MFLEKIAQKLKKPTLDLALFIASSDASFSEKEELLINVYKKEMNIDYSPKPKSLDKILAAFDKAKECDKRIVLFEMTALMVVDGTSSKNEKAILVQIAKTWDIPTKFVTKAATLASGIMDFYRQSQKLVSDTVPAKE